MKYMKKCVVIYTEGETDDEFYKKVLRCIKDKIVGNKFEVDVLKSVCITRIGKFQKKLLNKFNSEIIKKYKKTYEIIVVLCYDTDVFEFGVHPPINRIKLEKDLIGFGASKIIHIKAKRSIEDFFMYDLDGIVKYLKIVKPKNLKGLTGLKKIETLFLKANRIYQKGHKCAGLIDSLNMDIIFPNICDEIKPLCVELGVDIWCDCCKNIKQYKKTCKIKE